MACIRRGRLAVFLAMWVATAPVPAQQTEQGVSHSVRLEGPAQQVVAVSAFDVNRGTLLRVRLEISGVASGAVGQYGARGKQFSYSGRFILAETPNIDPRGVVATTRAQGVDSAPPSPDSLAAVDWHVAVYGSLQYTANLERFTGPGQVYLLYVAERSRLSIQTQDAGSVELPVNDSTLRARATVTYYYRPASGS